MRRKFSNLLKPALFIGVTICCFLFLSSCAEAQPQIQECLIGHQYGFWGGLWHGFISPISFIGSLFNDNIDMWAVNNNGGWYTFGFVLGSGMLFGSGTKTYSK